MALVFIGKQGRPHSRRIRGRGPFARRMEDEDRAAIPSKAERLLVWKILRAHSVQLQLDKVGGPGAPPLSNSIHRLGVTVPQRDEHVTMARDISAGILMADVASFPIDALFLPFGGLRAIAQAGQRHDETFHGSFFDPAREPLRRDSSAFGVFPFLDPAESGALEINFERKGQAARARRHRTRGRPRPPIVRSLRQAS